MHSDSQPTERKIDQRICIMIEEDRIKTIIRELSARRNNGEEGGDLPEWFEGYRQGLKEAVDELEALVEVNYEQ